MDKKYARRGLVLVGAEVQGSTEEAIQEVVDENRIKFPITAGISGPNLSDGIPHMVVFDVEGKLVYSGYPGDDAEDVIRKELRRVKGEGEEEEGSEFGTPSRLVENRDWTNSGGATVEAALLSLDGNNGTFIRTNGTTFVYDITKLSADDQELIRTAVAGE